MSESARTKFIAAGEKLYPELGYSKLSVRLLAAEAELSSGMFHHLFENKDVFYVGNVPSLQYNRIRAFRFR